MTKTLCWIIALTAIAAPALHLLSDILEWIGGGFSRTQLLINYAGFLPMPFLMIGLSAIRRPKIGLVNLAGAIIYGIAFIYFAHTTLYALEESFTNYELLWNRLGAVYTFHGGLMVGGGLLFGFTSLRAGFLWRKGVILFIAGLLLNLLLAFLPLPDVLQTLGSTMRNFGLIGIGVELIRKLSAGDQFPPDTLFNSASVSHKNSAD